MGAISDIKKQNPARNIGGAFNEDQLRATPGATRSGLEKGSKMIDDMRATGKRNAKTKKKNPALKQAAPGSQDAMAPQDGYSG